MKRFLVILFVIIFTASIILIGVSCKKTDKVAAAETSLVETTAETTITETTSPETTAATTVETTAATTAATSAETTAATSAETTTTTSTTTTETTAAPSGNVETLNCYVTLQEKQEKDSQGFHLIIKGQKGFYRLYQDGGSVKMGLSKEQGLYGNKVDSSQDLGHFNVSGEIGIWHTIAVEMNKGEIKIYYDGNLVLEANDASPIAVSSAELLTFPESGRPVDYSIKFEFK